MLKMEKVQLVPADIRNGEVQGRDGSARSGQHPPAPARLLGNLGAKTWMA